jgi:hypothetical protein
MKKLSLLTLLSVAPALAGGLMAQSNVVPGLDGRLVQVDQLTYWGRRGAAFPGGEAGMSMLNLMCNPGTVQIPWQAAMQPNHPKFGFLIVRENNGRMEQISDRSYVKHAFVSTNGSGVCGTCQSTGGLGGTVMGINCSDTYGAGNNGDRQWLGPAEEIDPWLGTWNPVGSYFDRGDPDVGSPNNHDGLRSPGYSGSDPVYNRVAVKESDLNIAGAQYYYGIHLVHQGEAVANRGDNLASRGFTPAWSGSGWSFNNNAVGQVWGSILQHWSGASLNSGGNMPDDGRFFVAAKVTTLGPNSYHYEYAVHNVDNSRGGASFRIPLAPGAVVQNTGFRDIDANPLNDWTVSQTATELAFSVTGTNALNWNMIFNCWFDCSVPPGAGSMTIDEARIGAGALSVNVQTDVPSGLSYATKTLTGTSCGICQGSFYELFATSAAFDLAGRSMTMRLNASGSYDVVETPVGFVPVAGTNLGLAFNTQTNVTLPFSLPYPGGATSQLGVCAQGYVTPGAPGTVQVLPTAAQFLSGPARWAGVWSLFNPTVSTAANVFFDANAARAILTWNGVPFIGGTQPSTFQMQFFPDGTVNVLWQSVASSTFATMVGWTVGGGHVDPGTRDLSATLTTPLSLCGPPFDGLTLDTSALPVIGTTMQWQVGGFQAGTAWGALLRSLQQAVPPIDLTAAGMPGCFQHVAAPLISAVFVAPGASVQLPQQIPNSVSLVGVRLVGQAAAYSPPLTPLGVVVSNAVVLTAGL